MGSMRRRVAKSVQGKSLPDQEFLSAQVGNVVHSVSISECTVAAVSQKFYSGNGFLFLTFNFILQINALNEWPKK